MTLLKSLAFLTSPLASKTSGGRLQATQGYVLVEHLLRPGELTGRFELYTRDNSAFLYGVHLPIYNYTFGYSLLVIYQMLQRDHT